MKIGIHHREGSFSDYWIQYCVEKNISYKIVNCYNNDIIQDLEDCEILMWHHHHADYKDVLFAKGLLYSLEQSGKLVFPNFNTSWHFDDKVGQKYLLESINAPLVPSFVFFDKVSALKWAYESTYPKVFKLKGGAGSSNVKLIRSRKLAISLINQSFKSGFQQYDKWGGLKDRFNKFLAGKGSFKSVLGGVVRILKPKEFEKMAKNEKGYFYIQEFIPKNDFDIRVITVGNKAFAIKRMVRENDFRASGSGTILYDKEHFNDETIEIAFNVSKRLALQCCAFDFVYDEAGLPLIVEISYGFNTVGYKDCVGYWNDKLEFFVGAINPYEWMVEDLIKKSNG